MLLTHPHWWQFLALFAEAERWVWLEIVLFALFFQLMSWKISTEWWILLRYFVSGNSWYRVTLTLGGYAKRGSNFLPKRHQKFRLHNDCIPTSDDQFQQKPPPMIGLVKTVNGIQTFQLTREVHIFKTIVNNASFLKRSMSNSQPMQRCRTNARHKYLQLLKHYI